MSGAEGTAKPEFCAGCGLPIGLHSVVTEDGARFHPQCRSSTLAALTTAEARIQELEAALRELEDTLTPAEQVPPKDPAYGDEVRALGLRIGFGALMASASHEWRQWLADNGYPLGSEFVAGPCRAVLESDLRAARHTLRRGK